MANEKKFLDSTGVRHLWSKISMEDYPNNETLIAVINAIDESKADITYVDELIANLSTVITEEEINTLESLLV